MICQICASRQEYIFSHSVLGKYDADYFFCDNCGYLCCQNPFWLEEAYTSPIACADTGIVLRNRLLSTKIATIIFFVFRDYKGAGLYLDAAGGYGLLTRLMRDIGFDFYWSDKYCNNLLAKGFDYRSALGPFRGVTCMEVLEHLTDPIDFVKSIFLNTDTEFFIFSTETYFGVPPKPDEWWYYSFNTGQHIGFFQERTLRAIATQLGLCFFTSNGLHIYSRRSINKYIFRVVTNSYFSRMAIPLICRKIGSRIHRDYLEINSNNIL